MAGQKNIRKNRLDRTRNGEKQKKMVNMVAGQFF
jgi:hypothetical protein